MTTSHNRAAPAPPTPVQRDPTSSPASAPLGSGAPGMDGAPRSAPSIGVAPRSAEPPVDAAPMGFSQVFADHAPFVWRALRRLGVADADADDVCQEVFLVVHRKLGAFEERSSLRTWLYGICLRAASAYRRRPHRAREETSSSPPEVSVPAPQDDDLERRRALERLDAALDELDEDKRAVFVLYELEQLSMAEVAQAMRCPLQTAYSRLHVARRLVEASLLRADPERSSPPCR